jgi:hypothetical protein
MQMSDIAVARHRLDPYVNHQPQLKIANPMDQEWDQAGIIAARGLETKISINQPVDDKIHVGSATKNWTNTPDFYVAAGDIVRQNIGRPLTCILFAYLCVWALKQAPKFTSAIEVVEIKRKADNHYVLVVGRRSGDIDGKLSDWNQDAFVIDLWGSLQGRGNVISQPPAIIVSDMADYTRRIAMTIPPWG